METATSPRLNEDPDVICSGPPKGFQNLRRTTEAEMICTYTAVLHVNVSIVMHVVRYLLVAKLAGFMRVPSLQTCTNSLDTCFYLQAEAVHLNSWQLPLTPFPISQP